MSRSATPCVKMDALSYLQCLLNWLKKNIQSYSVLRKLKTECCRVGWEKRLGVNVT